MAAANAGLLHGHGHAVSSQSIVRHDEGHISPLAYSAPLLHAAPVAYAAAYAPAAQYAGHDEYVRSI